MCRLYKSPSGETRGAPCVYIYAIMERRNTKITECTESVGVFRVLNLNTKKQEQKKKRLSQKLLTIGYFHIWLLGWTVSGVIQTQRNFWPRVSQISSNNEGCSDLLCHAVLTILLHIQTFCTFLAFCAMLYLPYSFTFGHSVPFWHSVPHFFYFFYSSPFASGSVSFAVLFSSLILFSASDINFKWESQWSPVKKCKGQTAQTGGHNTEVAYMNIHKQQFLY